jgi:hypothetical protein
VCLVNYEREECVHMFLHENGGDTIGRRGKSSPRETKSKEKLLLRAWD